jgi:hypothetical protein
MVVQAVAAVADLPRQDLVGQEIVHQHHQYKDILVILLLLAPSMVVEVVVLEVLM